MPYVKIFLSILAGVALASAADIRVGIIGTDTSHVPAFTKMLNDPSDPAHIPGARVVAAYKGGSPDIESSISRVDGYAEQIHTKYGVEIVPYIAALLTKVDAVLLETGDGRPHLAQVRLVFAAHKPVFIDKPLASTLADAREIARLGNAAGVPWFSSSSLRFGPLGSQGAALTGVTGVSVWGPGPLEPHHALDLSWYAIHPIELLYTIMGPGCETVTRTASPDADVIVGQWKGGRLGTVRAIRPYSDYGAVITRGREVTVIHPGAEEAADYHALVKTIIKFFQTGRPPVPNAETLEIFAFMDAAQRSKDQGGIPVKLAQ